MVDPENDALAKALGKLERRFQTRLRERAQPGGASREPPASGPHAVSDPPDDRALVLVVGEPDPQGRNIVHALEEHAIVSIADRRGDIVYVNQRFCAVSGYTKEELLGHNHRMVKSGRHTPDFYRDLWRTISRGEVWHGEICNRRKDGTLYWVESTIVPFMDDHGRPYQYVSVRTDVTRIKQAELAAERYKERFRLGQAYANIGTWEWNVVTGAVFCTERVPPLFGHPEGALETSYEAFYAAFLNAVHPDDRQAVIEAVGACLKREGPYEIEHRVVGPDGTVRWLMMRGSARRDAAGHPVQVMGVVQDIDDRKRAELALAESRRWLEEAQAMARLGHWHANLFSGELFWSDEIYRIFGHQPGGVAPSIELFQMAVHPGDRELVRENEARAAARDGVHDLEYRIIRTDGSVRYVHEVAYVPRDEQGKPIRLQGTIQDITERKRTEQALIAAKEEAERASRAKSEFLSNMSHELRTPMNAILGFAQLMEYDASLNDEQEESVREILKAGRHLLSLINEVLDLARVESGKLTLSMEPVELWLIVEESLSLIQPLAARRSIRLTHAGIAGVVVCADPVRLKQVLLNLLSNAVKYNRDGGHVHLEISGASMGQGVRIAVSDTGAGLSQGQIDRLFEPFDRLNADKRGIEGTGIGLAISQRMTALMGGSLGVRSEPGAGSTFWVELPQPAAAVEPVDAERPGDVTACGAPRRHVESAHRSVLYIEDNPANIKLVAQILRKRPHVELLSAQTPDLGVELARVHRPRLILLDINMPDTDGYQLMNVFQRDAVLRSIPVVAVTANAMPRDRKRGMAAGFSDYLIKPLDVDRFLESVDMHLNG